jgi:hypothetical protein
LVDISHRTAGRKIGQIPGAIKQSDEERGAGSTAWPNLTHTPPLERASLDTVVKTSLAVPPPPRRVDWNDPHESRRMHHGFVVSSKINRARASKPLLECAAGCFVDEISPCHEGAVRLRAGSCRPLLHRREIWSSRDPWQLSPQICAPPPRSRACHSVVSPAGCSLMTSRSCWSRPRDGLLHPAPRP